MTEQSRMPPRISRNARIQSGAKSKEGEEMATGSPEERVAELEAVIERVRESVKGWRSDLTILAKVRRDAILEILTAAPVSVLAEHDARVWDECLTAIEENEINTQQAREGNPYRKGAGQ